MKFWEYQDQDKLFYSELYGINGLDTLAQIGAELATSACSTPYGINGLDTSGGLVTANVVTGCSTPYGINGLDTG